MRLGGSLEGGFASSSVGLIFLGAFNVAAVLVVIERVGMGCTDFLGVADFGGMAGENYHARP